jgi:hypothetical protein
MPVSTTNWYQDPTIIGFVGAIVGALITGAISLFISKKEQKRRRVDCALGEAVMLLSISETIKEKLSISLDGYSVSSVYLFPLEIINSGDLAIRDQPVIIQLSKDAKIVDYKIETTPKIGFGDIAAKVDENVLELKVALFNPKERINIEVVSVDNLSDAIDIGLKNENVDARIFTQKSVENTLNALSGNMPLLMLSLLGEMPILGSFFRPIVTLEIARRVDRLGKNEKSFKL